MVDPADSARVRGVCHVFLAIDVAQSIDLNRAAELLRETATRPNLSHRFRAPDFIAYQPPPLRVTQACEPIAVGTWAATGQADITLFDFGAASVVYRIAFDAPIDRLADLADALQNHPALRDDARARVGALSAFIAPAMQRPAMPPNVEDYAVFQIETTPTGAPLTATVDAFIERHAVAIARILRGDPGPLSDQEVREALSGRMSYTREDAAIVDWSAAVVIDRNPADVLAVLEFANIELLELRTLDDRLDLTLAQSYDTLGRRRWWSRLLGGGSRELKRLAGMQLDHALLFEGVNNAIKLVGDQYLARLYRVASQRLGVPEWQASIRRKLATHESIYSKVSDHASALRMELIEWIIVLLIAFEVVMSFVR